MKFPSLNSDDPILDASDGRRSHLATSDDAPQSAELDDSISAVQANHGCRPNSKRWLYYGGMEGASKDTKDKWESQSRETTSARNELWYVLNMSCFKQPLFYVLPNLTTRPPAPT